MASTLNPYINFNGDARAAMEFYESIFGGTLTLSTFGEFGPPDAPASADSDRIMHGMLITAQGFTLMGADVPTGSEFSAGGPISVSLSGDDADQLHGFWDKLSASGTVTVPMEKQMWGDEFGMCVDRFGVSWLVNISQA
jgi:PhnB protein